MSSFLYIFISILSCFGRTISPTGGVCWRDICRDEKLRVSKSVTVYGFDDYSDPTSMQRRDYLTSLLDSAPCPPPWKSELLCSSNSTLPCTEVVYLLAKCLKQHKNKGFAHCHALSMCESVLTCSEFLVQFSHDMLECRVPEEVSHHVTKAPTTQQQKTSILLTKPTTDLYTQRPTQFEYGYEESEGIKNSSTLTIDIKTFYYNATTNTTISQPGAFKPSSEEGSSGGSVAAIIVILILLILILIVIVLYVLYKRQNKYKVTKRQWSTYSRAPLTRTDDGYEVCCVQWKRRDATANGKTHYTSVPSSEQQNDNQSKPAIDIVLEDLKYIDESEESILRKDKPSVRIHESEKSSKDKLKEDLVLDNQTSSESKLESEARESLEEEIFKSLQNRDQGALRENMSSEDEGLGDSQNGNESTDLTTDIKK